MLMLDCVQLCLTAADFVLRQSRHYAHPCRECAEAFERMEIRDCAAICHRCAES